MRPARGAALTGLRLGRHAWSGEATVQPSFKRPRPRTAEHCCCPTKIMTCPCTCCCHPFNIWPARPISHSPSCCTVPECAATAAAAAAAACLKHHIAVCAFTAWGSAGLSILLRTGQHRGPTAAGVGDAVGACPWCSKVAGCLQPLTMCQLTPGDAAGRVNIQQAPHQLPDVTADGLGQRSISAALYGFQ